MQTSTLFPTSVSRTGTTALQLAADVRWTTTIGDAAIGGLIRGRARSGKTTFAHRLVDSLDAAGRTVLLADPLAHGRTAELPRSAWIADTLESVTEWLADLDVELTGRINGEPHRLRGAAAPQPLFVVVDHAEYVLEHRRNSDAIERLATLGGRMGIAVILSGQSFPHVWPRQFEAANLLTFSYPRQVDTAGWGISLDDLTDAPQHFRNPDGDVTGLDLDAAL